MLLFVGWIASSNVKKSFGFLRQVPWDHFQQFRKQFSWVFWLVLSYSKSPVVCLRGFVRGAGHPKSWPLPSSWTCCSWSEETIDLFLLDVPLWVLDNMITKPCHCFQKCVGNSGFRFWYKFLPAVLNRKSCTKFTPKGADLVGEYGS
jgi:hypothetical protein